MQIYSSNPYQGMEGLNFAQQILFFIQYLEAQQVTIGFIKINYLEN